MSIGDEILEELVNKVEFTVDLRRDFITVTSGLYNDKPAIVERKYHKTGSHDDLELYNSNFYFNIKNPNKLLKQIRRYHIKRFKDEYS